jgi:hypothetical protein
LLLAMLASVSATGAGFVGGGGRNGVDPAEPAIKVDGAAALRAKRAGSESAALTTYRARTELSFGGLFANATFLDHG